MIKFEHHSLIVIVLREIRNWKNCVEFNHTTFYNHGVRFVWKPEYNGHMTAIDKPIDS